MVVVAVLGFVDAVEDRYRHALANFQLGGLSTQDVER
jgi:hypothetical protein